MASPDQSYGGKNAYKFDCAFTGDSEPYGLCQIAIHMMKAKIPISGSHANCMTAIKEGKCQAVVMMREERLAGEALYFEPQPSMIPPQEPKLKAALGPKLVGKIDYGPVNVVKKTAPVEPAKSQSAPDAFLGALDGHQAGFADVVNKIAGEQETYTEAERAQIKERRLVAQEKAHEAVVNAGVTVDPRISETRQTLTDIARRMIQK